VREAALAWLRSLRFTVHVLEGRTRRGHPLRILYAGSASYRHYLRRLAYANDCLERPLGRYWRWQLAALAANEDVDLRVTRCARALRGLLAADKSSFYAPEWLWADLALDPEMAKRRGKAWSGIRRNGLTYSVTKDGEALRHFYERMYLPLIKASHGEAAQPMAYDYMLQRVADGEAELVSIRQGDRAVGGCFVVYDDGEARLFSQGILDADRDLLRQRVGVATYLFSFIHLLEQGFDRANLGRSRPFLTDGALQFKLERGGRISGTTGTGIAFSLETATPGAQEILCANPWIGEDGAGLVTLLFTAAEVPCPAPEPPGGVARVTVVPLGDADAARAAEPVPSPAVAGGAT
jgi:hypothetical protein